MQTIPNKQLNTRTLTKQIEMIYDTNCKIRTLKKHIKLNRILILSLILWQLITTGFLIYQNTEHEFFTQSENELIMQLEEIPTEEI